MTIRWWIPLLLTYHERMAIVVFLRGVNVGGHRTFRPSVLARELSQYHIVNIGAAGSFVVRKPPPRAKLRTEILAKLPFAPEIMICDGRDVVRLETDHPFGAKAAPAGIVRFVTILSKEPRVRAALPISLPPEGEWLLRIVARSKRFVFGEYRRDPKTIGYLGQIDKLFGVATTTRNWNTVMSVVRLLKGVGKAGGA